MLLSVQVTPNAKQSEIVGWDGTILKVRLHAIPEKGKANKELIQFLAKTLGLPKSSLALVRGETSRTKQVEIPITLDQLIKFIEAQYA